MDAGKGREQERKLQADKKDFVGSNLFERSVGATSKLGNLSRSPTKKNLNGLDKLKQANKN